MMFLKGSAGGERNERIHGATENISKINALRVGWGWAVPEWLSP